MAGEINFGLSNPNAFFQGAANMSGMLERMARRKAGKALAAGDTKGGIGTLQSEGMLGEADKVQQGLDIHQAAGDTHEARLQSLDFNARKERAQMVQDVAQSLDNVRQTHGDAAVLPAFEHLVPIFKAKGATDQEIETYRQALRSNPQQFLTAIIDHTKDYQSVQTQGGGVVIWNKRTGKFEQKYQPPQFRTVGPNQDIVQLPDEGSDQPVPSDTSGDVMQGPNMGAPGDMMQGPNLGAPGDVVNGMQPSMIAQPEDNPQGGDSLDLSPSPDAVQQVESGGNPLAISAKGARGPMQTMPGTLQSPGFGVQPARDNSPAEQARVGRDYLGALYKHYGNPIAALIAYNWGPKNFDQWRANGSDFTKLPKETQQYILRVGDAQTAQGPGAGGEAPAAPGVAAPGAARAPMPAATPSPGATTTPGGARVIARGQRTSVRSLTPAELEAKGYAPGSVVQVDQNGVERLIQRGPTTTGGGAAKVSPQDAAYLSKLRTSATELSNMATLMDEFVSLNKRHDTGGTYAIPGVSDVQAPWNPDLSRMMAITDQITPAMRNGLPGAASDRDVSMFRGATVGVGKPYATNLSIARAGKAFADRQQDYVAFMESFAKKNGTVLGAQERWKQYVDKNPLFKNDANGITVNKTMPWRQAFPDLKPGTTAAPAGGGWKYLGTEGG